MKDRASGEAYVIKMIQRIVQDHPPEGNEHELGVIVQDAANRGIYRAKLDFISEWADEPQEKVVIQ
ncbi:hypothetical protein [uncultured Jannaschia sp.]|uniref:hypothetical protein n=1 Tax=uncultured Jannaschia sp. TaxID=293347 RepID=UPI002631FC13|nr:hypothetical protein [uncultured Jannaschia sp.]